MDDPSHNGDAKPFVSKLAALVRLVQQISRAHEAEDVYEPALSALREISDVDRAAILLLDRSGVARFVAGRGLSDRYRAAVEGHFPWSIDDPDPQPIWIGDIDGIEDPTTREWLAPLFPHVRAEGISALAFIPLLYRERLVGKFMLYYDHPHQFAADEVEIASAVAYLVAFTLERARLYAALEESDQRKDVFLATLAHELRNPLAAASSALALTSEHPEDLGCFRSAREVLDRSVRQIAKLVDDLLDVSRITRGVITIDRRPVDLTDIVHHAIATIQPLIASRAQELTLALEPLWLEADALRLEQVVTNLLHNATKYTPRGGHVWVVTRSRDQGVEIQVRDDGIGIDPLIIPRLFDLFEQVDKSLARSRGGLGIGLTIIRQLVELHGGSVTAASRGPGQGTEFTVWLPGRIGEQCAITEVPEQSHGSSRRVLVVDDNEDAATMLGMLLRSWGHEVWIVGDGPAAIAAVAAHEPEVVLLDLGLPGMTGYEVAERLRASGTHDLRIIAVSGYGQPEDVARARAAGCDAHIAKPVDFDDLERNLQEAGP